MDLWKTILTALLSLGTLFLIAKWMGHKQMSQLDFFDYITGITIGSIAAELATELENPLRPLIAMLVYGVVTILLTCITGHFPRARKYINGTPTIVLCDGKLYRKNMKKAKLDLSEFLMLCRQQGYFDLKEIHTAIFEYNGQLTILPRSTCRPVTPDDLHLSPEPAHIQTEMIMDGKLLSENLKRKNLDSKWLSEQLKSQGYQKPEQIYLALCDDQNTLTLYPKT